MEPPGDLGPIASVRRSVISIVFTPNSMLGDSFLNVIVAARSGAEWAWATLYRELAPSIRGYLRFRGAEEPDDLLGEVFLQLVRDLDGFDGSERDFRAWVFTIAHHRLIDARRRQVRRPIHLVPDLFLEFEGDIGNVEDEAMTGLTLSRVRELVGRLSPDQQDVVLLRLFGELSVPEVAGIVGKRAGAVKAALRRGLATLRREISREAVSI
jgi:RNA polymerase sigma-70 factor, ECF subfamily